MIEKVSNLVLKRQIRCFSSQIAPRERSQTKVRAWQIHSYGDLTELHEDPIRIPHIQAPDELLIQVEAASVNPIDVLMVGGYGQTILQIPRRFEMELPLTLGRDFAGRILQRGHGVDRRLAIGERVYGFRPLHVQGAFAEAITAHQAHVLPAPPHLSPAESASLVYAAMTAWSALFLFGGLRGCAGKRALVLGASGGVGAAAVQLLRAQGCAVVAACATDALPLVAGLRPSAALDYTDPEYARNVAGQGYFDVILDCAKFGFENVPSEWRFGQFISLNSPLLRNTDEHGLVGGLLQSASVLVQSNLRPPGEGRTLKWGFFTPSTAGFRFIDGLIRSQEILPVIHKEFKFEELPNAFREVMNGHLRGKVVVKV